MAHQEFSGGFQPSAIPHSRGAHRLTAAAAEAGVEVLKQSGIVGRDLSPLEPAHQHNAAARAVGLVTGGEVSGAGREAESAVDAGIEGTEGGMSGQGGRFSWPPALSALSALSARLHSIPSNATAITPFGSNVPRRRPTSRPTPSR